MSDFPQPPPWPSPDQHPPDSQQPPPPSPFPDQPPLEFPQPPRNGDGTAALVLGLIGLVAVTIPFLSWSAGIFGIIGLILGFVGRGRAKRGEATNGTKALWGIITSAVAVVLWLVVLVALITGWSWEFSVGTDSPEVIVYDLEAGDCLADPLSEGGEETVPCSKPHSEEIYVTPTLPEGDFPGQDAIFEQAEELCITEFESFIGLPYEESALDIDISTPSERTWRVGDRLVICAIFDPTGDTTGTLADANR